MAVDAATVSGKSTKEAKNVHQRRVARATDLVTSQGSYDSYNDEYDPDSNGHLGGLLRVMR